MKATKLSLAIASMIGASFAGQALALDLYVDNRTQQIFAEPGANRSKLGSFEKVEETAAQKAEIAKIKEDMALKTNEMKALDEHMQAAEETKLKMGADGVSFESKDGNFKMKVIGRLQMDAQTLAAANNGLGQSSGWSDGASLRRARLGVEGAFYKDFGYKFEYDFMGGQTDVYKGITDAYLNYTGLKDFNFQVGQFKEPYGMEIQTSNRFIPFIERSMMSNAFSDSNNSYQAGFGTSYVQPRWTAKAAIQTLGANGKYGSTNGTNDQHNGDSSWQLAGRVTGLPWYEDKNHLVHLGASGSQRKMNSSTSGTTTSLKAALGGNLDRTLAISYTVPTGTDSLTRYGAETALVYGPFAAMAEYTQVHVDGSNFNSSGRGEKLEGYYAYMTYMLTGESRNYKASTGAWDRIKPARNFDGKGGWGAFEVAAGFDALDLTDGSQIRGGNAKLAKLGLNWYPNSRFKIMANAVQNLGYNNYSAPSGSNVANKEATLVEMRAQVDF